MNIKILFVSINDYHSLLIIPWESLYGTLAEFAERQGCGDSQSIIRL